MSRNSKSSFLKRLLPSQWSRGSNSGGDGDGLPLSADLLAQLNGLPPELRQQAFRQLQHTRGGRAKVLYHIDSDNSGDDDEDEARQLREALERSLQASEQARPSPPERAVAAFHQTGALGFDVPMPDGFYACYGNFEEATTAGEVPLLPNLRLCNVLEGREVVLFDPTSDPDLAAFRDAVLAAAEDHRAPVAVVASMVASRLGAGGSDDAAARGYWRSSIQLQKQRASVIVPVGALLVGLSRHRALLAKLALGWLGIPCALAPGDSAWRSLRLLVSQDAMSVEINLAPAVPGRPTLSASASSGSAAPRASAAAPLPATDSAGDTLAAAYPASAPISAATGTAASNASTAIPSAGGAGSQALDSLDADSAMTASPLRAGGAFSTSRGATGSRPLASAQLSRVFSAAAAQASPARPQSVPLDPGIAPARSRSPLNAMHSPHQPLVFSNQLPNPFLTSSRSSAGDAVPAVAALPPAAPLTLWPFDQPDLLRPAVRPRRQPRGAARVTSASSPNVSSLASSAAGGRSRASGEILPLGSFRSDMSDDARPDALRSEPRDDPERDAQAVFRAAAASPLSSPGRNSGTANRLRARSGDAEDRSGPTSTPRSSAVGSVSVASTLPRATASGRRAELGTSAFADPDAQGTATTSSPGGPPSSLLSRFASGAEATEAMPWFGSSRMEGSYAPSDGSGEPATRSGVASRLPSSAFAERVASDGDALPSARSAAHGSADPSEAIAGPLASKGALTPVPETRPLVPPPDAERPASASVSGKDSGSIVRAGVVAAPSTLARRSPHRRPGLPGGDDASARQRGSAVQESPGGASSSRPPATKAVLTGALGGDSSSGDDGGGGAAARPPSTKAVLNGAFGGGSSSDSDDGAGAAAWLPATKAVLTGAFGGDSSSDSDTATAPERRSAAQGGPSGAFDAEGSDDAARRSGTLGLAAADAASSGRPVATVAALNGAFGDSSSDSDGELGGGGTSRPPTWWLSPGAPGASSASAKRPGATPSAPSDARSRTDRTHRGDPALDEPTPILNTGAGTSGGHGSENDSAELSSHLSSALDSAGALNTAGLTAAAVAAAAAERSGVIAPSNERVAAIQSAVSAALSTSLESDAEANLRSLAAIHSVRAMESLFRMWIREADIKMTEQVIGRGAYGQVLLAKFRTEKCAVKQIICETKAEYRASLQEMLLMQELQFDKIVRFFGAIKRSSRCIWMCMEYMPFSDLRKVLHSRKHRQECRFPEHLLTLPRRLKWAKDVVAALDLLHSRRVVHRDLKPGNILISNRFDAVLSDFGLSRVREAQQSRLQASGPGTVSYAAPEALSNNQVSPASDMFSFGCLLWELLAMREPWAELNGAAFQIMTKLIYERQSLNVDDIPAGVRDAVPVVIDVLRACFSFQPAQRPSAVHVHEVLDEAIENL